MDKIGIIRLSSLGDIILTEPVARLLKQSFPKSRIIFFTKAAYQPLLEMFAAVDEVIGFEIPGSDKKLSQMKARAKGLPHDFDLLLDLHRNLRSRALSGSLKAACRCAYKKARLMRQMAVWFKTRPMIVHTAERYLAPLAELGIRSADALPRLTPAARALSEAEAFLARIKFDKGGYVVLAIGASHPAKHYPLNQFVELAEIIVRRYGLKILVADQEHFGYLNLFESMQGVDQLEFGIGLEIGLLAGVIKNARLTISNDSGIMHLSAAVGTPTAGLFGPTHPLLGFAPLGADSVVITTGEKCTPCSLHGERLCYRDRQYCFENMTPEMIIKRVKGYLE